MLKSEIKFNKNPHIDQNDNSSEKYYNEHITKAIDTIRDLNAYIRNICEKRGCMNSEISFWQNFYTKCYEIKEYKTKGGFIQIFKSIRAKKHFLLEITLKSYLKVHPFLKLAKKMKFILEKFDFTLSQSYFKNRIRNNQNLHKIFNISLKNLKMKEEKTILSSLREYNQTMDIDLLKKFAKGQMMYPKTKKLNDVCFLCKIERLISYFYVIITNSFSSKYFFNQTMIFHKFCFQKNGLKTVCMYFVSQTNSDLLEAYVGCCIFSFSLFRIRLKIHIMPKSFEKETSADLLSILTLQVVLNCDEFYLFPFYISQNTDLENLHRKFNVFNSPNRLILLQNNQLKKSQKHQNIISIDEKIKNCAVFLEFERNSYSKKTKLCENLISDYKLEDFQSPYSLLCKTNTHKLKKLGVLNEKEAIFFRLIFYFVFIVSKVLKYKFLTSIDYKSSILLYQDFLKTKKNYDETDIVQNIVKYRFKDEYDKIKSVLDELDKILDELSFYNTYLFQEIVKYDEIHDSKHNYHIGSVNELISLEEKIGYFDPCKNSLMYLSLYKYHKLQTEADSFHQWNPSHFKIIENLSFTQNIVENKLCLGENIFAQDLTKSVSQNNNICAIMDNEKISYLFFTIKDNQFFSFYDLYNNFLTLSNIPSTFSRKTNIKNGENLKRRKILNKRKNFPEKLYSNTISLSKNSEFRCFDNRFGRNSSYITKIHLENYLECKHFSEVDIITKSNNDASNLCTFEYYSLEKFQRVSNNSKTYMDFINNKHSNNKFSKKIIKITPEKKVKSYNCNHKNIYVYDCRCCFKVFMKHVSCSFKLLHSQKNRIVINIFKNYMKMLQFNIFYILLQFLVYDLSIVTEIINHKFFIWLDHKLSKFFMIVKSICYEIIKNNHIKYDYRIYTIIIIKILILKFNLPEIRIKCIHSQSVQNAIKEISLRKIILEINNRKSKNTKQNISKGSTSISNVDNTFEKSQAKNNIFQIDVDITIPKSLFIKGLFFIGNISHKKCGRNQLIVKCIKILDLVKEYILKNKYDL